MTPLTPSPLPRRLAASLSILFFLGMLLVNALADALPLNGVNTGALSDELPNLFVPAGLTFAIWGLIYLLLAAYVCAAALEVFGRRKGAGWTAIDGLLFIVNAAANMAWIFVWHRRRVGLSLLFMLLILGSLIILAERIASRLGPAGSLAGASRPRRILLSMPIRVYLGWICVATIANVTALLVKLRWDGFGLDPRLWTVLVIAVGLALALGFVFRRGAVSSALVVVWAYAGIVYKRLGVDPDYSRAVWLAAGLSALLILLAVGLRLLGRRRV